MNTKTHSVCRKPIAGKIAVILMTFADDEGCLTQCFRYLTKQQSTYNLEFFVLDDARKPLKNIPANVHYWKTHFDRQCNLNGQECAHGMLIEMLKIARMSKAEYIMKVDCDMCIRDLENFLSPLKENPLQVVGFKLHEKMNYCAGVTYVLPVVGLFNAVVNFCAWYARQRELSSIVEFAPYCPEDWAITRCVADVNDWTLFQWDNSYEVSPENWLMSPFNFAEVKKDGSISPLTFSRFQLYDFVNFGNRFQLSCDNPRTFAADCMKAFADFDLQNTFTTHCHPSGIEII